MAYHVGDRIGDYEVVAVLGAGGMGQVYQVRNILSDRIEAMKVLLPNLESDPELADRFTREIKVQASLKHPHIAALHTAQRIDNKLLMVMEFVEGQSLDRLVSSGPLPPQQAVDIVMQVLSALGYAHERGIVHRDIKPANIMLQSDGSAKLMDFGIARMAADHKLTQTGRTLGSLYYMSPEQINGVAIDGRSDLYSLGISLYELVTGGRPFNGDSEYSIMAAHLNAMPVPPVQIDARVPATLNDVILMSLAKEPGQRFQTAEAFRSALANVFAVPQAQVAAAAPPTLPFNRVATPPPPPPAAFAPPAAAGVQPLPVPASGSRNRLIYLVAGVVLAVGTLAIVGLQLPKYLTAKASGDVSTSAVPAAAPVLPAPGQPTPAPPTTAAPEPSLTLGSQPPASHSPATSAAAVSPTSPSKRADLAPAPAAPSQQTRIEIAQAPPPPVAPLSVQQAPTPAAPAATMGQSPNAIRQAKRELSELGVRAQSVLGGLQDLEREQRSQGLGLSAELANARSRLTFLLDEAEQSIREGDPAEAQEHLTAAERTLTFLERKLGK